MRPLLLLTFMIMLCADVAPLVAQPAPAHVKTFMDMPCSDAAPLAAQPAPTPARWSVFVYMNADNELEPYAFKDLDEMKRAGSLAGINVVLLLDRAGRDVSDGYPKWTGAVEFRFGEKPDVTTAKPTNMGDGRTLAGFLCRAKQKYPADRYAVILWCHGAGWRDFQVASDNKPSAPVVKTAAAQKTKVPVGIETHLFKASSADHGDQLFNAEAAKAIATAFAGKKVDLLAFDSCLMGMLEAAYAFRHVAEFYVASEELVPGYGFEYKGWLSALAANPNMDAVAASKALVHAYRTFYSNQQNKTATLAAVDLSRIDDVANATTAFSNALRETLKEERQAIVDARKAVRAYDPYTCEPKNRQCRTSLSRRHVSSCRSDEVCRGGRNEDRERRD